MMKYQINPGDTFGHLTAIEPTADTKNPRWVVRCECGNIVSRRKYSLISGESFSCGCKPARKKFRDNKIGRTFGMLTVIRRADDFTRANPRYLCVCKCGNEVTRAVSGLTRNGVSSCGCANKTHGLTNSRVYNIWDSMIGRCYRPSNASFATYSENGITVCERWRTFQNFFDDMGHPPTDKHCVDRIDNSLGYSPDNCRWVTTKANCRNKTTNKLLTYRGETLCMAEWCDRLGLTYDVVSTRLHRGWTVERALSTPIVPKRRTHGAEALSNAR